MHPVLNILLYNIVPIFIMIMAGIFLGRKFKMDINTLTKISFYITVPAFTFTKLYSIDINKDHLLVLLFACIQLAVLAVISNLTSRSLGHTRSKSKAFQNSIMFYNSGNIGVPLITLVFSTGLYSISGKNPWLDLALSTQVIVLVVQNTSMYTIGYYNASSARGTAKAALMQVLRQPTIYVVPLAFILKLLPLDLRQSFFWPVLEISSNALVAISLLSLGVQLTVTVFKLADRDLWISVAIRLIGSPLLALLFIKLLGITGIVARVLFISASVPTAVNTSLIAAENNNEAVYASQTVLISTVLCAITLVPIIYVSQFLFPI